MLAFSMPERARTATVASDLTPISNILRIESSPKHQNDIEIHDYKGSNQPIAHAPPKRRGLLHDLGSSQ